MEATRHESVDVLAAYVRRVDLFKDHAGVAFFEASTGRTQDVAAGRGWMADDGMTVDRALKLIAIAADVSTKHA